MVRRDEFDKVDPHFHIWDLKKNYYPWLQDGEPPRRVYGDSAPLRKDYLLSDYLKDLEGFRFVKTVYLQCGFDPKNPVGETRYVQSVADSSPTGFPNGIVAHADLHAPDIDEVLRAHCESPNMRGIRVLLSYHDKPAYRWAPRGDYTTDPAWIAGYERLAAHKLSLDCQLYPHQMPELARVARQFPEIPVIINHTGMPIERESGGLQVWRDGMRELAEMKHTSLKISGLGMVDHNFTTESIRPIVREAIEIFGVDRCMFASNFPVDKLKSTLPYLFDSFLEITADLPLESRKKLFHDNAVRIYRL